MRVSDQVFEIKRRLKQQKQLIDFINFEPTQRRMIESPALVLIAGGGNRASKTLSGAARMSLVMARMHPNIHRNWYQKMRIVTEDLDIANNTVIPKLRQLLPSRILKGGSFKTAYNKKDNRISCPNYGEIQIKTNKQDVEAHRGADLDLIWFDEETKKEIHSENIARLGDRAGLWQMTFTPEKGASFIHDEYMTVCRPNTDKEYHFLSLLDNIHIDREAQIRALAREDDRTIRIKLFGEILNLVGLVYPEFNKISHVVQPFKIPANWNVFVGVDFGIRNPAAAVFWAMSPKGEIYQFDELYRTGWTIEQLADEINKLIKTTYPHIYFRYGVYDGRSGAQRTYQTSVSNGDVFQRKCEFGPWYPSDMSHDAIPSRINAMHKLLLCNQDTPPTLRIMSNCRHTLREINLYNYGKERENRNNSETPIDANNHAMNGCEYIAATSPNYFDPNMIYTNQLRSKYSRGGII